MIYRFRDYTLDEARRELWRAGRPVAVEPKVFQSCSTSLSIAAGSSKAELLEQCWPETFVSEAALTRCLTKLRKVQPRPQSVTCPEDPPWPRVSFHR